MLAEILIAFKLNLTLTSKIKSKLSVQLLVIKTIKLKFMLRMKCLIQI